MIVYVTCDKSGAWNHSASSAFWLSRSCAQPAHKQTGRRMSKVIQCKSCPPENLLCVSMYVDLCMLAMQFMSHA